MLYVILCDGAFDQVCESEQDMKRERSDLKAMGFRVQVKKVQTWAEANALEGKA